MEVLLAVAVFAVVLAAINAVFYSALRLRNKTAHLLDDALPVHQALAVLRRDLQCAVAPGARLAGPMQSLVPSTLTGQGGGLQLYTATGTLTSDAPWGDIQKVIYQLRPATNGLTSVGFDLVRSLERNLLYTAQEEYVDQWLMGNVQQLEFTFFDGSGWVETWDASTAESGLPKAVRVRIQRASEDQTDQGAQQSLQPLELLVPLVAQVRTNQTQTAQQ